MTTASMEAIKTEVSKVREFLEGQTNPLKEELERLKASVIAIQSHQKQAAKAAILATYQGADRPRILSGPYRGFDLIDLAINRSLLQAHIARPIGIDNTKLEEWKVRLQAAMDSTTAATGDELVSTQEAAQLWMDVNLETMVAPLVQRVTMPSNPFDIPLQLGDVNWYPGTENIATTSTAPGTAKQTLTAYELVAQVPWSLSLEEDAVIAMQAEVRSSLVRNAAEILDDLLLNADTTETNNINADGATIAKTTAGKGHWLLGFDGLIHLPIVDNTGQASNIAGAIADDNFNKIRALMVRFGVRPSECVYVMDIRTYLKALSVSNFRTLDKLGSQATILTGQLGAVEGIPVIVSEQMKVADTDGKVTDAGNGTDTGRILIFNRTQWRLGFRRELSIESERDIQKRQLIMVVSLRLAFMERGKDARSAAKSAALAYNITGI